MSTAMCAMKRDSLRRQARAAAEREPQSMEVGWRGKGDVRNLKNRLDAYVTGLSATVESCKELPESQRKGWGAFVSAWRSYFNEEESFLRAKEQWEEGLKYEAALREWQRTIAAYKGCVVGAPVVPVEPPETGGDWLGALKVVAIAGAVIAVALTAKAVIR